MPDPRDSSGISHPFLEPSQVEGNWEFLNQRILATRCFGSASNHPSRGHAGFLEGSHVCSEVNLCHQKIKLGNMAYRISFSKLQSPHLEMKGSEKSCTERTELAHSDASQLFQTYLSTEFFPLEHELILRWSGLAGRAWLSVSLLCLGGCCEVGCSLCQLWARGEEKYSPDSSQEGPQTIQARKSQTSYCQVTKWPGLLRTVGFMPIFPSTIINNPSHSQKCPHLDNELYSPSAVVSTRRDLPKAASWLRPSGWV